jgi:DNA integrity scanning protein DisA with diadenylate cyclase activity
MILLDPILFRLNQEIQRISQKLDIDMFLGQEGRNALHAQLRELVEQMSKAEIAINVPRTTEPSSD